MDAKDLRKEAAVGDRSKDVTASYSQTGGSAETCVQIKTYQDAGSSPMGKAEAASARPCAVIGPDRVMPPTDTYRRPPDYPYKPLDYHHPTRNISPRQTFQENMQRIMVPPSYATTKHKDDHGFQLEPDIAPLRNSKLNVSTETKYCDVPYVVNPIVNDLKNVRTSNVSVPNTSTVLTRSAPQGWPLVGSQGQSSKPYGATELYQYPEYPSCAAPRAMYMTRPHRTVHEISGLAAEPYYHDANIRFKPYPTEKERCSHSRYDYIGNCGNTINAPPVPTHKVMPTNAYPGYSQVPLKYMDTRMSDPAMTSYQRPNPQAYNNISFRNQVIHPPYAAIQGNCLQSNKFYPYPDSATKSMASLAYSDYESSRPKSYTVPDGFYINDIARPHLMKSQVMAPNYPTPNMHVMHPHPYYRKDVSLKNYDHLGQYRNIEQSINLNSNPLPRFATQFSNTGPISPADLFSNNTINVGQPTFQDDFGYLNQSPSVSARSFDTGMNRFSNDPFRRYDYNNYGPVSSMQSKCEPNAGSNQSSKDKKNIDVRQFLQMWNEGEEESNENNTKDNTGKKTPTFATGMGAQLAASNSANQEQLYVMGIVNVPSEELGKYEHIQKVSKLPENIKGYNSIEILHKFEEVIESSNLNDFKSRPPSAKDFRGPLKNLVQFQGMMDIPMQTRPLSPLDVEAKISQSVIHKEVGCNFEIRPCSPPMLNVENATSIQNVISERAIEKVTNHVIPTSSMHSSAISPNFSNAAKCRDRSLTPNKNTIKSPCCKMSDSRYPTVDIETNVKPNYSLQDLESNSGVCLASLPRLDNDIELSFPEVNQQFINANKVESVIISTPAQDLPLLDVEKNPENTIGEGTPEVCRYNAKLDKHKKLKRKISAQNILKPRIQAIRTDSVIIKNPDTNKSFEDSFEDSLVQSPISDCNENPQKDPINLTYVVDCTSDDVGNDGNDRKLCDGLAIDFSLSSTDRHSDDDQIKSLAFNDHKDSCETYQSVEYDHDVQINDTNSKFDTLGTDMTFNRSPGGDLERQRYQVGKHNKSSFDSTLTIAYNFKDKSMNLEKDMHEVELNTDSAQSSSNSNNVISNEYNEVKNINIRRESCDLKEQTPTEQHKQTKTTKEGVDMEKNGCTTEIQTPVIHNKIEEGFLSFSDDAKQLSNRAINMNTEDHPVCFEKNEYKQTPFTPNTGNIDRSLLIRNTLIETDTQINTQEQSRYSTAELITTGEQTNIQKVKCDSFDDSDEDPSEQNNIECSVTGCAETSCEKYSKEEKYPKPLSSALSTLEQVEILQGSQTMFFEQPLTPMDITPESSLIHDDADDGISQDEILKMDSPDNSQSSFQSIDDDLLNTCVRKVSYFYKEMFSPWMRKLVVYQIEYDETKSRKTSPSQEKPACSFQYLEKPISDYDILNNLNGDDVNDTMIHNLINSGPVYSDRHEVNVYIDKTNNMNQTTTDITETGSDSSKNLTLNSCMTITDMPDLLSNCVENASAVNGHICTDKESISVNDTFPIINLSAETATTMHISGIHSNEIGVIKSDSSLNIEEKKTIDGLDSEHSLQMSNLKKDTHCSDDLIYLDTDLAGNDTRSSDIEHPPNITKKQSINDDKITNISVSDDSLKLSKAACPGNESISFKPTNLEHRTFSGNGDDDNRSIDVLLSPNIKTLQSVVSEEDSEDSPKLSVEQEIVGDESMILEQRHLENLDTDFQGNQYNNTHLSDVILSTELKSISDESVVINKLPKNCLDAIKNEYASDSEECSSDNEVERIKPIYASDSDEVIDKKYRDKQDQVTKFDDDKEFEEIIKRETFSISHDVSRIKDNNETQRFENKSKSEPNDKIELYSLETNMKSESIFKTKETSRKKRNEKKSTYNSVLHDKNYKENENVMSPYSHVNLNDEIAIQNEDLPDFSTENKGASNNADGNDSYALVTQETPGSETIQFGSLAVAYRHNINSLDCSFSTTKSLKRSFSDSDLSNFIPQNASGTSSFKKNKRKKLIETDNTIDPQALTDGICSSIQNSRRNSVSSVYNESNVSFCIFIDNAGLLPENCSESEKIQCITEIAEDCLSCVQTDPIVSGIDSAEIVSFVEEMNEYSNNFPTEDCLEEDNHRPLEESWVDDVACVETVVSEDIAEDIIISASPPMSDRSIQEYEDDEADILNINNHSDKVKYIYGDKMCSNDAQLLQTLYRTPQMNVNKKLVIRESQNTDECNKYYDRDALEKVLSESNSFSEAIYEPESVAFNTSSLYSPCLEVLENDKENIGLDTISRPTSPFDDQGIDFTRKEGFVGTDNCVKTQDDTVHSCESSIDNVFSYIQREESSKCKIPSSPEVSSTTTEERNSSMLKIRDLSGKRVSRSSEVVHNRISCKYTETNDYLNTDVRIPARPLITKAAQKYIPPLKETTPNLKVKLTLPQHSLLRLKQLKTAKETTLSVNVGNRQNVLNFENLPNLGNIPKVVNIESKPNIINSKMNDSPKKTKPKFEDVLKSIEETQFQIHKDKSKKTKKGVPKVVIKKNWNGSHYASTSNNDTAAPDLTGRKWQPWVFLERSCFIDKMALNGKTRAVYSHRKGVYVLAEKFKKYKSVASSFVISKPKVNEASSGRLKYTIRLKHYC